MRIGDSKIKSNYDHCKRDLGVHQSQLVEEISFSSFPATTSAQEAQEKEGGGWWEGNLYQGERELWLWDWSIQFQCLDQYNLRTF